MARLIVYTALAAAMLAPAPLIAQSPQPASATSTSAAASQAEPRTVSGCVGAGLDGRTFTFTGSVAPTSPVTDRDPSVSVAPPTPTTWTLVTRNDIDLTKYVGKKVELTGSSDMTSGMSAEKSDSATRSPKATSGPRFHVKSVRVLAETCS
jgi:hypothetical protein